MKWSEIVDLVVSEPERFKSLCSEGSIDLECRGLLGETPLHFCAIEGYTGAVRVLHELGAEVNVTNNVGNTPLIDSVLAANLDTVIVLLSIGADRSIKDGADDSTALELAEMLGFDDMVDVLLQ